MTLTLPGADIRGYYQALGIELPGWALTEASVQCFADPDAHRRGDRDPSCSVNLDHGAWHCHACGAAGGAFDAATARGYTDRAAIDLMVAYRLSERRPYRLSERRPYRRSNANVGPRSGPIAARPARLRARRFARRGTTSIAGKQRSPLTPISSPSSPAIGVGFTPR